MSLWLRYDAMRGWRRFGFHFAIFFGIPHAIAGSAYLGGVSAAWVNGMTGALAFSLAVLIVVVEEMVELAYGKQGVGKMIVDLGSKISGAFLGFLSWGGIYV